MRRSSAVSIRGRRAQFRSGDLVGDEEAAEAGEGCPCHSRILAASQSQTRHARCIRLGE